MNWTKDLPARAGFYWFRKVEDGKAKSPWIMPVTENSNGRFRVTIKGKDGGDVYEAVETFEGEWAGPIAQPSC